MTPLEEEQFHAGNYAYTAVAHPDGGFTLGIAIEGFPGFYRTDYHSVGSFAKASEWADMLNDRRLTRDRAFKIVASTMRLT